MWYTFVLFDLIFLVIKFYTCLASTFHCLGEIRIMLTFYFSKYLDVINDSSYVFTSNIFISCCKSSWLAFRPKDSYQKKYHQNRELNMVS